MDQYINAWLLLVAQVQGSFQDVRAPPLTISTLQSLISLPLIRPELFSKGILKKNFIPGVLLFGPPGTGKVFALCATKQMLSDNSMCFSDRPCWPRPWPKTAVVACWTFRRAMCKSGCERIAELCTHQYCYFSYEMYVGQGEKNVKVHTHTHTHTDMAWKLIYSSCCCCSISY